MTSPGEHIKKYDVEKFNENYNRITWRAGEVSAARDGAAASGADLPLGEPELRDGYFACPYCWSGNVDSDDGTFTVCCQKCAGSGEIRKEQCEQDS